MAGKNVQIALDKGAEGWGSIRGAMKIDCIVTRDEDGTYCATVPALPGCISDGRTLAELRTRLAEAVGLYLEDLAQEEAEKARADTADGDWRAFSFGIVPGAFSHPARTRRREAALA